MNRFTKAFCAVAAMSAAAVGVAAAPASASAWGNPGMTTQYPAEGGSWEYGFQNAALRSYYTVNKCHGSTVLKLINGKEVNRSRSADTASGHKSIAEVGTVNSPNMKAEYYYRTC
ncbi:lactococcin 972 family bacteriocin [Kitasatospora sp. NPDC002227]|uniref:lactococcin 972 family bacteriocin n=1 Tax=Kitasatospora sp. NPDC002227 TaxID=3154773 RepID=UPI00332D012F